ncbi:MAG: hypothetical protein JSV86_06060 [Gemmatimonadota bacterium]|nr:MAG: hypothetical protein JSV86_06060 [Gemmatimonadota bacterium]
MAELERDRTTALKLIDFSRDAIALGGAMALDALLTIEAALRGESSLTVLAELRGRREETPE